MNGPLSYGLQDVCDVSSNLRMMEPYGNTYGSTYGIDLASMMGGPSDPLLSISGLTLLTPSPYSAPLPATAAASVVGGCIPEPVLAAGSISSAAAGAAAVAAAAGDEEVQLPLPQPSNVVAEAIGAYFEPLLSTPQAPLPPLPSLPQEPLMDWQQAEQPPPPPQQQQQTDQQQTDQQQHAEEHTQAAGELLQGAGVAGRQAAEQVLEWQLADAVLQRQDQPLTLHVPPSPPAPLPLPHTHHHQQHNGQQHKQQQLELQQPSEQTEEALKPPPPPSSLPPVPPQELFSSSSSSNSYF
ncbi:hypothetical protein VOLCADRAFT_101296 [Volvox carteri f. nagariensis]|uniref:Uncharacterized protein n=1 Tax=Volvox carteri f. nagariensis TaxID=3068 RepID=D8UM91_VOLCA|nr:uncharacterized protein VOLCADRAFT_101296 [Volvox carteri f. nagariensis]EFJ39158.1 hypothetical protein VOLCADRAFT_101296 [Volvox carteri f. nagariensis]|eukprot:XP_002959777.1 hypothetical protein VOLCADRAFT_101296 [Volvox carteri f. nagariensis]